MNFSQQKKQYPFDQFEPYWQQQWLDTSAFHASNPDEVGFDPAKPKYFVLDMFPYPSGDGLHVGHVEGYTATDIIARYKRMRGFNVLHPMGWDAFGLPAEQFAIKTGQHPRITTEKNVKHFKKQLQSIGFSYDWDREISTTDPGYFRWTQWIFCQLYNSWFNPETQKAEPISSYSGDDVDNVRLAYVSEVPVNWCPELGTVLANEEVVDGKSEVGGFAVERRPLRQWMLRITAFAQRLIDELEGVDWPESIKLLQRNWIGRSEGAEVTFLAQQGNTELPISVFTTRPDTLYGATYLVLSPEHPAVSSLTLPEHKKAVADYQESISGKSDLERTELSKEKTGVALGSHAVNPVNGESLPIWIADYVLSSYGSGAIMAVPAHDERDYEFAKKFGLPIRQVVRPENADAQGEACFSGEGIAVNSIMIEGLPTREAKAKITRELEKKNQGVAKINYKLRDWLFSRQRYWGEPFPIVWESGQHRSLGEEELPVLPPEMEDFRPTGTPEPPLSKAKDWVAYSETARRETNTMPQWAGSCWYYFRFCDAKNENRFIGKDAENYWMSNGQAGGVDLYIGGTEHAVLHLLYARFWHKVLFDLGYASTNEPFQRLVNQGMILGPDGQKMSKSRGNVINPDEIISDYGADALRLYEMFMGPLEQMKPWSTKGVEGVYRFLARVWRLVVEQNQEGEWVLSEQLQDVPMTNKIRKTLHQTIKKVSEDIEQLSFNTAISQMMICTNELTHVTPRPVAAVVTLLQLLSPFAPHLAEELHKKIAEKFFPSESKQASQSDWPTWNEDFLIESEVEIILQVNGKLRDRVEIPKDMSRDEIEKLTLENPKIRETIEGKNIVKIVVVPGKIANVVAK
ncbi:MAG: leucine--tRNA ligase [Chthoniobacterales bacterium]